MQKNANGFPLYRGVPVSKPQMKMAERLRVSAKHVNYPVGFYYADIAYPKDRIIIEYEGWFWHNNDNYKAWARTGYLLSHGWNLIIVKSRAEVPTMAQLKQALYNARHGYRYQEITLSDWKN